MRDLKMHFLPIWMLFRVFKQGKQEIDFLIGGNSPKNKSLKT